MRKKRLPVFLLAVLWGSLLGLTPLKTRADEGLKIYPARIEEMVKPGQTIAKSIKVINNSESAKKLFAYVMDFKAEGEEGKAQLIMPGTEEGAFLSSWITVAEQGQDFEPGEEREFAFTISIPETAGPGGYYSAMVFGTQADDPELKSAEKGAAMSFSQQAASLILLQIAGQAEEEAKIRDFVTDKSLYSAPFEIKFSTRIENLGNVHIRPHGTIEIYNSLGKKVKTIIVNDKGSNILPQSIRRFDIPWQENFGFGRYKAILAVSYGTDAALGGFGVQTLDATKFFWIMPGKIMVIGGIGVIIFLALAYWFLRHMKNTAVSRAMSEMGMSKQYYDKSKSKEPSHAMHTGLIAVIILIIVAFMAGAVYLLK